MDYTRTQNASTIFDFVVVAGGAGAVAWIGNTKGTVKPSKTSMSIRWSAMLGSVYAAIPRTRESGDETADHQ
jgi:hypothetical protein